MQNVRQLGAFVSGTTRVIVARHLFIIQPTTGPRYNSRITSDRRRKINMKMMGSFFPSDNTELPVSLALLLCFSILFLFPHFLSLFLSSENRTARLFRPRYRAIYCVYEQTGVGTLSAARLPFQGKCHKPRTSGGSYLSPSFVLTIPRCVLPIR